MRSVKISSPDVRDLSERLLGVNILQYIGWNADDAVKHYLARIAAKIPYFESMEEPDLNYVKVGSLFENFTSMCLSALDDQRWRTCDGQ